MKAKEMRDRDLDELMALEREATDQLFQARIKNATHQLDDTSAMKKARREIARIKTVIAERSAQDVPKQGAGAEEE